MNPSFSKHSSKQVENGIQLLGICLGTSYFQLEDKFYLQADGRAKSS
jgi:hypothetical protein